MQEGSLFIDIFNNDTHAPCVLWLYVHYGDKKLCVWLICSTVSGIVLPWCFISVPWYKHDYVRCFLHMKNYSDSLEIFISFFGFIY